MRLTPDEIFNKMCELADDFEKLRRILDDVEPLYDIAKDEVLNNISANRYSEFNLDNQEVLTNCGKLNIEDKDAVFRAEYPKLADQVVRAQKAMKRIEKSFEHYKSMNISTMSEKKHDVALMNGRT